MRTLALILALTSTTSAFAAEPFVGVWASSARACKANPLQTEDAAIKITRTEIQGGEWLCTIKGRTVSGPSWTLKADCAGEGNTSHETFQSAKFVKCAPGDFHPIAGD